MQLGWQGREECAGLLIRRGAASTGARQGRGAVGAVLWLMAAVLGGAIPGAAAGPLARLGLSIRGGLLLQTPGPLAPPTDLWVGAISPTAAGLNWTNHGTDETGYEVWRKVGAGDWIRTGEAPARATRFVDAGVMPEIPYTYRVRAHNVLFVSDWSNEAAITIPRLPTTPTALTAGPITATSVALSWAGVGDNTSFTTVWRKSVPGAGDFARIALVPGSISGYVDLTADATTGYAYRVRAETNYFRSDWSNEITVTTSAPPAGVTVKAEVPSEATAPDTRVTLDYHLPEGVRLDRNPFFVVADPSGALFELRPAYLTQPSPDGEGYLDLHTELYPAGAYRVRAQLWLRDPGNRLGGAASSWTPLTVPPPAVVSLTVGAVVTAGQSIAGSVRLAGGSRNQPAVVTLASSDPSAAAVPISVSIPPWAVEATFVLTAGEVTVPRPVTITAAYNGSSLNAPLTVVPAPR